MEQKIKEQILAIRDTGLTNMLDIGMVQRLAYERDFYGRHLHSAEVAQRPHWGIFSGWSFFTLKRMKGGEAHDRCIIRRKEGVHYENAQQYECGGWLNGEKVRCRSH